MYQTPQEPRSSKKQYDSGATSPNIRCRVMEKEELSGLNDRLAVYIDRMRHLELQNSKLTAEIQTCRATVTSEAGNVKALYEAELTDARKMIDDFAKEKTVLQLENQKTMAIVEDLRIKLDKETKLRIRVEDELKRTERRLHEKESLLLIVSKERKQLDDRVKELEAELKKFDDDINKQKKLLENEIIKRISAENRAQTLEEEASFNQQKHAKELEEVRCSAEDFRISLDRADGPGDYDSFIADKLQELREEFEEEAEKAKKELEDAYKAKFDDLRRSNRRDHDQMTRLMEKNTEIRSELDKLTSDYNMLESKNIHLQKRLKELEDLRALDKEEFKKQLQQRNDRINQLEDDLLKLEKEYEALLGIKIALDVEIAAYRKMIEGEEERLNISQPIGEGSSSSRHTKRRRGEETVTSEIENATTGSIEVEECDPSGRFVRIKNNSDDAESLGGWCIQRVVDGKEEELMRYSFTPKFVLKGQKNVTVWSQSSGVKHKAPTDLVLKNGDWMMGRSVVTEIVDSSENIVAKQTMKLVGPTPSRRSRRERNQESCHVM